MTYVEDDLTEALIKYHKDRPLVRTIQPEAHYNYYGNRGAVDLHIVFKRPVEELTESLLIEVKSTHAVRQASGANEIIRQFNRMRRYFYDDEHWFVPLPIVQHEEVVLVFELAFIPSRETVQHLTEYAEMYNEAVSTRIGTDRLPPDQSNSGIHRGVETAITLRHPDRPRPELVVASDNGDRLPPDPSDMRWFREMGEDLYADLVDALT